MAHLINSGTLSQESQRTLGVCCSESSAINDTHESTILFIQLMHDEYLIIAERRLSSKSLLLRADLQAIPETWIDVVDPANINKIQLPRDRCTDTVAVYKRKNFACNTISLQNELTLS